MHEKRDRDQGLWSKEHEGESTHIKRRYLAEKVVPTGQERRKQAKLALAYAHLNEEGHLPARAVP